MTQAVQNVTNIIWPFAIILLSFVVVQAVLFMKNALRFNKKYSLYSSKDLKSIAKSSAVSSIGPSFSVVVVVIAMISLVGPAVTFMRTGVIGAADYELWLADVVATAMGVTLGGEGFTEAVFTCAIFGMVLGSAPYMLNLLISLKPLDKAAKKESKKKRSFIPILGMTAELGFLGYWTLSTASGGVPKTVGIIFGLLSSMAVTAAVRKSGNEKLNDWVLGIALIGGMVAAAAADTLIG
ncbi:DUF5058 family protein [Hespellia stercorisuis]|uniref:DUF5058 domain-containing protein n=1 Tax=Hespellia stercorisuis DSM 15480 TaxID=1121950 RepID=A0A1M6TW16_9FIRM|nr:DUF5058 family protein [Hespellia stercorisuis]SHK61084.1 protein of unknown function [Hespellia stercorisuis DSM 15480]